jgi:hypothetical protein
MPEQCSEFGGKSSHGFLRESRTSHWGIELIDNSPIDDFVCQTSRRSMYADKWLGVRAPPSQFVAKAAIIAIRPASGQQFVLEDPRSGLSTNANATRPKRTILFCRRQYGRIVDFQPALSAEQFQPLCNLGNQARSETLAGRCSFTADLADDSAYFFHYPHRSPPPSVEATRRQT